MYAILYIQCHVYITIYIKPSIRYHALHICVFSMLCQYGMGLVRDLTQLYYTLMAIQIPKTSIPFSVLFDMDIDCTEPFVNLYQLHNPSSLTLALNVIEPKL